MTRKQRSTSFLPRLEWLERRDLPSAAGLFLPLLAAPVGQDTSQLQHQHDQMQADFAKTQQDAANPAHDQQEIDDDFGQLNDDFSQIKSLGGKTNNDAKTANTLLFLAVASGALDPSDALFAFVTLNQIQAQTNQANALVGSATTQFADKSPGGGEPSLTEFEHEHGHEPGEDVSHSGHP